VISIRGENTYQFRGLSTDKKPINKYVGNGSLFIEMDTSVIYTFDAKNQQWLVLNWNESTSEEEFEQFKEEVENQLEDIRDLIATDVKEILGDHAELETYVQSHLDTLKENDKLEVLVDETEEGSNTVYRYLGNGEVSLIGRLGPYYTKTEVDQAFVDDVALEIEEPTEGETSVEGNLVYTHKDGSKHIITSLSQLRDYLLTPAPDTPDIDDTEAEDAELTVIVTDSNGEAVKMSLEQLRQRFITSSSHDNTNFDDAQIGEFIYDEIVEGEEPASWISMNGQATWEAEYNNPDSTLNKYYKWSDDVNKPYKEDLWNTIENRPANINDARKDEQGQYVYDDNGNYIYDNCERCWLGAINAPGASYPWAVVELPIPFEGTIRFKYKDEEPVYPWGEADRTFTRGFAIASIPSELNKPELQINAEGESQIPLLNGDLVITLLPKVEEE